MNPEMRHVAVIFDLDGTLIRTRLRFDLIREEIGLSGHEPVLESIRRLPSSEQQAAEAILHKHEDAAATGSELQPGALATLAALRERGILLALMTRNRRETTRRVLSDHAMRFDLVRTREDGTVKPSPEPVWEICKSLKTEPSRSWVVGDFHFDILCGKAAGARTVYFWEPDFTRPTWADEADHVIRALPELIELVEGQPSHESQ